MKKELTYRRLSCECGREYELEVEFASGSLGTEYGPEGFCWTLEGVGLSVRVQPAPYTDGGGEQ